MTLARWARARVVREPVAPRARPRGVVRARNPPPPAPPPRPVPLAPRRSRPARVGPQAGPRRAGFRARLRAHACVPARVLRACRTRIRLEVPSWPGPGQKVSPRGGIIGWWCGRRAGPAARGLVCRRPQCPPPPPPQRPPSRACNLRPPGLHAPFCRRRRAGRFTRWRACARACKRSCFRARLRAHACVRTRAHSCVRTRVPRARARVRACMRAGWRAAPARACKHSCFRAHLRAHACVRACVRARIYLHKIFYPFTVLMGSAKGYLLLCQEFCGIFSIDCI